MQAHKLTMKDRLQIEISHAKSIGEFEYAEDLTFIVMVIDGKAPRQLKEKIKTAQQAADFVGINLKPFEV